MQHTMNAITTTQNQIHQGKQHWLAVTSATSGHLLMHVWSILWRLKRTWSYLRGGKSCLTSKARNGRCSTRWMRWSQPKARTTKGRSTGWQSRRPRPVTSWG